MTFRSFSRFVRWYRWPALLALGAALSFLCTRHFYSLDRESWSGAAFLVLAFALISASIRQTVTVIFRSGPIKTRWQKCRAHKAAIDAARLRAMPLRGWTR